MSRPVPSPPLPRYPPVRGGGPGTGGPPAAAAARGAAGPRGGGGGGWRGVTRGLGGRREAEAGAQQRAGSAEQRQRAGLWYMLPAGRGRDGPGRVKRRLPHPPRGGAYRGGGGGGPRSRYIRHLPPAPRGRGGEGGEGGTTAAPRCARRPPPALHRGGPAGPRRACRRSLCRCLRVGGRAAPGRGPRILPPPRRSGVVSPGGGFPLVTLEGRCGVPTGVTVRGWEAP